MSNFRKNINYKIELYTDDMMDAFIQKKSKPKPSLGVERERQFEKKTKKKSNKKY